MSHRKNLDTDREAFVEEQEEVDVMNSRGVSQPDAEARAKMRREMREMERKEK